MLDCCRPLRVRLRRGALGELREERRQTVVSSGKAVIRLQGEAKDESTACCVSLEVYKRSTYLLDTIE